MVYDKFLWKETFEKGWADGYFFKETVNLDFDIIDVTFTKDLKDTVIPVVSSPIDIVPSPTPPPNIIVPVPNSNWYDGLLNIAKWLGILLVVFIIYRFIRLFIPKKKKGDVKKNE